MKKSLSLQITEPCHEQWNEMTVVEQGRHCASCAKTVVDFEKMSDAELIAFFKKPSTESLCGRFAATQLDRPLILPQSPSYLKYAAALLVPTLMIAAEANAQSANHDQAPTEQCQSLKLGKVSASATYDTILIKGYVKDVDGNPMGQATVQLYGGIKVTTDSTGYFALRVKGEARVGSLFVEKKGYGVSVVEVRLTGNSAMMEIKIGTKRTLMGLVAPVRSK